MLIKIFVIFLLMVIVYCLASGLFFLIRSGKNPEINNTKMAKALTWRIILSFVLFLFLIIAYFFGWIVPHSILPA